MPKFYIKGRKRYWVKDLRKMIQLKQKKLPKEDIDELCELFKKLTISDN